MFDVEPLTILQYASLFLEFIALVLIVIDIKFPEIFTEDDLIQYKANTILCPLEFYKLTIINQYRRLKITYVLLVLLISLEAYVVYIAEVSTLISIIGKLGLSSVFALPEFDISSTLKIDPFIHILYMILVNFSIIIILRFFVLLLIFIVTYIPYIPIMVFYDLYGKLAKRRKCMVAGVFCALMALTIEGFQSFMVFNGESTLFSQESTSTVSIAHEQ
jgi:hypothetical protein